MADTTFADIMKIAREAAGAVKGAKVPEPVSVMFQEVTKLLLECTDRKIEQKVAEVSDMYLKKIADIKGDYDQQLTSCHEELTSCHEEISDLKGKLSSSEAALAEMQKDKRELNHQVDSVAQYNRRDNIKITGVPYAEGENLVAIVNDIAQHIGAEAPDSSTMHRIFTRNDAVVTDGTGRRSKEPSIIMRMVRRTGKFDFMDKRKVLRTNPHPDYPDLAIYEDLTPLRSRMLYALRNRKDSEGHKVYKFTWSKEGRIYCRTEEESKRKLPNGKQPKPRVVNRLEDLADLGFTQEEIFNIAQGRRQQ